MKNYEIKNATAEYTGGGIYIYCGQLENGLFFRACDGWECISICDEDTSSDEADYNEFYEIHEIESITDDLYISLFNNILNWIISNKPRGNYLTYDLKNRIIRPACTK